MRSLLVEDRTGCCGRSGGRGTHIVAVHVPVSERDGTLPGMQLTHAMPGCNGLLHCVIGNESKPPGAAALTDELQTVQLTESLKFSHELDFCEIEWHISHMQTTTGLLCGQKWRARSGKLRRAVLVEEHGVLSSKVRRRRKGQQGLSAGAASTAARMIQVAIIVWWALARTNRNSVVGVVVIMAIVVVSSNVRRRVRSDG